MFTPEKWDSQCRRLARISHMTRALALAFAVEKAWLRRRFLLTLAGFALGRRCRAENPFCRRRNDVHGLGYMAGGLVRGREKKAIGIVQVAPEFIECPLKHTILDRAVG